MNCKRCGSLLTENDKFCKGCGAAVEGQATQPVNNGTGVVRPVQPSQVNTSAEAVRPVQPSQVNTSAEAVRPVQPAQVNTSAETLRPVQPSQVNTSAEAVRPVQPSMSTQSVQPTVQSNMYNQNNTQAKTKNGLKYVIVGIVAILLVALAVIGVFSLINKDDDTNGNNLNNTPSTNQTSTYKVNFKGFTFNIPTNLIYEAQDDYLLIGDEANTWTTSIEVISGSYSQLVSNKGQLQGIYQKLGYESTAAVEETINGSSYITLELSKGGTNALLGLTKANSMYVFGLTVLNVNNEFDYDILKNLSSILSNATYVGESNSIAGNTTIDMSEIENLAR